MPADPNEKPVPDPRQIVRVTCHNESGVADLCGKFLGVTKENGEDVLHILIERKGGRRPSVTEIPN